MRSTAIVKVAREVCDCDLERVGRPSGPHPRYVARCRDCDWEASDHHLRVIVDASGTGLAQRHRVACPRWTAAELTDKARTMLRSAPAPAPTALPKPQQQRGPITVGLACPDPRVRRAAEKACDAVDRLRDLLAQWEDRAAARAEVERLETELAAAKARLTGRPAAPQGGRPDSREVRAWAEAAGVPCPARGRIPAAVRAAYDAAHVGAAS